MPHYRLYHLGPDNHIRQAESLECEDDGAAVEAARARQEDQALELWQDTRVVARLARI